MKPEFSKHFNVASSELNALFGRIFVTTYLNPFPYFEKMKVSLWDHHAVCVSVNPPYQLLND
jgi:hypothetical protein